MQKIPFAKRTALRLGERCRFGRRRGPAPVIKRLVSQAAAPNSKSSDHRMARGFVVPVTETLLRLGNCHASFLLVIFRLPVTS